MRAKKVYTNNRRVAYLNPDNNNTDKMDDLTVQKWPQGGILAACSLINTELRIIK